MIYKKITLQDFNIHDFMLLNEKLINEQNTYYGAYNDDENTIYFLCVTRKINDYASYMLYILGNKNVDLNSFEKYMHNNMERFFVVDDLMNYTTDDLESEGNKVIYNKILSPYYPSIYGNPRVNLYSPKYQQTHLEHVLSLTPEDIAAGKKQTTYILHYPLLLNPVDECHIIHNQLIE